MQFERYLLPFLRGCRSQTSNIAISGTIHDYRTWRHESLKKKPRAAVPLAAPHAAQELEYDDATDYATTHGARGDGGRSNFGTRRATAAETADSAATAAAAAATACAQTLPPTSIVFLGLNVACCWARRLEKLNLWSSLPRKILHNFCPFLSFCVHPIEESPRQALLTVH